MFKRLKEKFSGINWGWLIFLIVLMAAVVIICFAGLQAIINWLIPVLKK